MSETPPLDKATQGRVLIPFAIVTMIWGSTWLVIHSQFGPVPTEWSVAYRFAIGALSMFVVVVAMKAPLRMSAPTHALAAVLGLVIFAINYNAVYASELHITSGLVAVIFSLLVPLNAVLARIFLKQGLSRPFLMGSGVAMLGVVLLFIHEWRAIGGSPHEVTLGIGLALLAVFFASIGNVLQSSPRARTVPMATLLAWGMTWGSLADAALAWARTGPPVFDLRPSYIAGLLYLGIIASAVAFTLYFNLIRRIGAARGGYVNVLIPVIAMGFSTVFEHYHWSVEAALGGLLVLAGLVLAMRARGDAATPKRG
ncbi:MAG TPA: DMT family transporter [Sphingomonas sp.]|uniref:DMT family transporter n=1 Tax=Sphingomonas sp. TaxID=28214 RepID=UPI002C4F9825|nr:DMT family transporter [Sphingomonas sp.]HMI20400.1 DMT family transporter [Sphingomonas sp.]